MTRTYPFTQTLGIALVLALLVFSMGCTDSFTGSDELQSTPAAGPVQFSKLRHPHLMHRVRQSAAKSASSDEVGLILGVPPGLDKHRLIQRYKLVHRYKIAHRYSYEHVFDGLAINVVDSLGVGDFEAFMQLLEQDPDILWFEFDIDLDDLWPHGNGGNSGASWGLDAIGAPLVGDRKVKDVRLFVIDSGVSHKNVKVEESIDFVDPNGEGEDYDGHGTHIAGIIAAKDKDGVEGVVKDGELHSIKVMGNDGVTELSTAIAAVEYVTGEKLADPAVPMVVNMSLGTDVETGENISLDQAIEASIAAGVVYVISAGNEGVDAEHVSPAHVEAAITVGAYDPAYDFTAFSNHGPMVDILAPGVDILSLNTEHSPDPDPTVLMTGTSMATGFVTGAVALYMQKYPQASAAQVEQALLASSRDMIAGAPSGTTSRSVHLEDLLQMQLPPFFQHALVSGSSIEIKQELDIKYDGHEKENASVFANGSLDLKVPDVKVEGFGYAGGNVKPEDWAEEAFKPKLNPTELPGYQSGVEKIEMPDFKAEDYAHLATQHFDKLEMQGHYELGTAKAPAVWYVDGSVKTKGPVTFSGYGIVLVKGSIEIKHSLETTGNKADGRLGLYAGGNVKVKEESNVEMVGQLFSAKNVTFEGGLKLTGSVTAGGKIVFKSNDTGKMKLYFRPPARVLTDLIWPMEGS